MHTVKFDIIKLTNKAVYTFSEFKNVNGNIKLGKFKDLLQMTNASVKYAVVFCPLVVI